MKKRFIMALVLGMLIWAIPSDVNAAGTLTASWTDAGPMKEGQKIEVLGTQYDDVWGIRIDASPAPTTSYVVITATASGNCGIWVSGMGPWGPYGSSGAIDISKGQTYVTGLAAYPKNDSVNNGTTTCTVSFSVDTSDPDYSGATISPISINITDDESNPTTPESTPVQKPTPTSTTASTEETKKPDVPQTKLVDAEGNELKLAEGEERISFEEKQSIVLSGTTVPSGEVKLFIFSDPQEATVTADAEGDWTYTIASIEPGDHRVEIEVTDPATGKTSDRAEVLAFRVAQAEITEDESTVSQAQGTIGDNGSSSLPFILGGVLVVTAGGAWYFVKKRKNKVTSTIEAKLDLQTPQVSDSTSTSEDTPKTD